MTLEVVETVWEVLKHHINVSDLNDAADDVVGVLIDVHGYDPKDVQAAFKDHPVIKKAVNHYLTDHASEDFERDRDDWMGESDIFDELDFDDDE